MFVRWERREGRRTAHNPEPGRPPRWSAILVEAVRIDGKPRQRHVALLASIGEDFVREHAAPRGKWREYSDAPSTALDWRCAFWSAAGKRLRQLRLTVVQWRRIQAALAAKVAPVTAVELEAFRARSAGIPARARGAGAAAALHRPPFRLP
jgi:hypothetical protein